MKNLTRSLRTEKSCLLLLAAICLALVAGAVWLQVVKGEQPCPLCILQRYALVLIALAALAGVALRGRTAVRLCEALAWLVALAGLLVAARHVYIQWFPLTSCGIDTLEPIVDGLLPARLLPLLFQVQGFCETLYPPVLGLSLAQWALGAFSLILVLIPLGIVRDRRKAGER